MEFRPRWRWRQFRRGRRGFLEATATLRLKRRIFFQDTGKICGLWFGRIIPKNCFTQVHSSSSSIVQDTNSTTEKNIIVWYFLRRPCDRCCGPACVWALRPYGQTGTTVMFLSLSGIYFYTGPRQRCALECPELCVYRRRSTVCLLFVV